MSVASFLVLKGEAAIGAAYRDLADRLGSRVFLAPMIKGGVEMVLGVTHDPQFGALVLLGAGGILVEVLEDVAALQVPVERWEVHQVLGRAEGAQTACGCARSITR